MISDIKDTILERIKNPFLGSLIVIWLVLNWKSVFFLLFSSLPIEERYSEIYNNYYSIWRAYIAPPILAFIYTAYKDYLFSFIEKQSRRPEQIRRISKIKDLQEVYTEREELETIKARTKDIAENYKGRNELHNKILDLDKEIEKHKNLINENKQTYDKEYGKLNELKERYKSKVELIFHFYTTSHEVREFLKNKNNSTYLDNIGENLIQFESNSNMLTIEEIEKEIEKLDISQFITRKLNSSNTFDFKLNIIGQYLLHREIFRDKILENENINFTPNLISNNKKPRINTLL